MATICDTAREPGRQCVFRRIQEDTKQDYSQTEYDALVVGDGENPGMMLIQADNVQKTIAW
jgi:hypothetical protein